MSNFKQSFANEIGAVHPYEKQFWTSKLLSTNTKIKIKNKAEKKIQLNWMYLLIIGNKT